MEVEHCRRYLFVVPLVLVNLSLIVLGVMAWRPETLGSSTYLLYYRLFDWSSYNRSNGQVAPDVDSHVASFTPTEEFSKEYMQSLVANLAREPSDVQGCHTVGLEIRDDRFWGWEFGLNFQRNIMHEQLESCVRQRGIRRVLFLGDSVMRNVYSLFLDRMHAPPEAYEGISQKRNHDNQTGSLTVGHAMFEFRFVTASERPVTILQEEDLTVDILFLNSGLWDLTFYSPNSTAFLMHYMWGLSSTIKFLQERFKGRMVFLATSSSNHSVFERPQAMMQRMFRYNSKTEALNRFAKSLVEASGFEFLDVYSYLFTGQGAFAPNLPFGEHGDGVHPDLASQKVQLDVMLNEVCFSRAFSSDSAHQLASLTSDWKRGCRADGLH